MPLFSSMYFSKH